MILKLARGHLAYELNVFHFEEPDFLECVPLEKMSDEEFLFYNSVPENQKAPELGSRAFLKIFAANQMPITSWNDWQIIQEGKYRYRIDQVDEGDLVKFVFSEYLACTVIWN